MSVMLPPAFRGHPGADGVVVSDGRLSDVALTCVRAADVTVTLVGEQPSRSGEDRCISTLELPAGQLPALEAMAALGKPLVVVVVYTGRPLELGRVLEIADAVVVAWHPGTEAGPALPDLVFGRVPPSGCLPTTFPRNLGHVPSSSRQRSTARPLDRDDDRRVGRHLDSLVFPELTFGYGLTYTTFAYGDLEVSNDSLPLDGSVTAAVVVTNTGTRRGREIVQRYVHDVVAEVTRPPLGLADWRAVDLAPGESARVGFTVTAAMFGYHDAAMRSRVEPGEVDGAET